MQNTILRNAIAVVVVDFALDSTRLDVRKKSQTNLAVTEGGAPYENPKEPRRSPKFENGERKTINSTYKSIRDENYENSWNNNCSFFCEIVKQK